MNLAIFNGSPRNKKSNSNLLISQFLEGYHIVNPEEVAVYHLASRKRREAHREAFMNSDIVLIFLPLYTDCMPGIVKEFIEDIARAGVKDDSGSKKIGFVVQSGFRESIHSIYLERYLRKLVSRMNYEYLGTVIRGGVEGIQMMPARFTKKLFRNFYNLGMWFAENTAFDPKIQAELASPMRLSARQIAGFKVFSALGMTNFYWNSQLKKHGVYEQRFDQPYVQ